MIPLFAQQDATSIHPFHPLQFPGSQYTTAQSKDRHQFPSPPPSSSSLLILSSMLQMHSYSKAKQTQIRFVQEVLFFIPRKKEKIGRIG